MRSKLIYIIFVVGVLMAAILVTIILTENVPNSGGATHPEIAGLQIGGDGAARMEHIGTLGLAFHCLLLAQIVLLSLLGVSERYRSTELIAYMGGSLIFMLLVAWQMYSGHQQFLETEETGHFLGFPTATAWATYGTWIGAIPLILIYSIGFRKYIYTPEDEEKYNELLAEKAERMEQE